MQGSSEKLDLQCRKEGFGLAIKEYAVRFLKYNSTDVPHSQAEVPATPESIFDSEIIDVSWEDHLTEVWITPSDFIVIIMLHFPLNPTFFLLSVL